MPRALRGANWMSVMMALCGIFRVELAEEMAAQDFILAGLAEGLCLVGRRLALFDDDARHAGVECGASEQAGNEKGDEGGTGDHVSSL